MEHQVLVFPDDLNGVWGWECLTCGAERIYYPRARAAENAAQVHRVRTADKAASR